VIASAKTNAELIEWATDCTRHFVAETRVAVDAESLVIQPVWLDLSVGGCVQWKGPIPVTGCGELS